MSRMLIVVTGRLSRPGRSELKVMLVFSKAVFCMMTNWCKRLLQDLTDKTMSTRNISEGWQGP
jgi:hypothetical protein